MERAYSKPVDLPGTTGKKSLKSGTRTMCSCVIQMALVKLF